VTIKHPYLLGAEVSMAYLLVIVVEIIQEGVESRQHFSRREPRRSQHVALMVHTSKRSIHRYRCGLQVVHPVVIVVI